MNIQLPNVSNEDFLTKSHVYIFPHTALRSSIAHYTYMPPHQRLQCPNLILVPDVAGCIVLQVKNGLFTSTFWGGTTKCVQVEGNDNMVSFRYFIEFLPSGAFHFLHHNQSIYLDQKMALKDIDANLADDIAHAYEQSNDLYEFTQYLDHLFIQRQTMDSHAVKFMQRHLVQGNSIQSCVDATGYSTRHVQRMFLKETGCSMKHFQRIARINLAVQYLYQNTCTHAHIALKCGYYDEAHFIHDFISIMCITPSQYQQTMSYFYNENYKF